MGDKYRFRSYRPIFDNSTDPYMAFNVLKNGELPGIEVARIGADGVLTGVGARRGVVTMIHQEESRGGFYTYWTVYKPDGTLMDIPSHTLTAGLKEAIQYAHANGYAFRAYGGGGVPGAPFVKASIVISEQITFPTGWISDWEFNGIDFQSNLDYIAPGLTMFTFDTCDMTRVAFKNCQIRYYSAGIAIHFNPMHDNGESFAGFTESRFELPTIVMLNTDGTRRLTEGIAVRWSSPDLRHAGHPELDLIDGNGLTFQVYCSIEEVNGGQVAFQLDSPGNGQSVTWSEFHIKAHTQGAAYIQHGTSATNSTQIINNQWHLNCAGAQGGSHGVNVWGGNGTEGGDLWYGNLSADLIGFNLNTSARRQRGFMGTLSAVTPISDGSTTHDSFFESNRLPTRHGAVTVPASGTAFQNSTAQRLVVAIANGTVSAVTFSADNSIYDATGKTSGLFTLEPGQWLKITYSVVPDMAWYF